MDFLKKLTGGRVVGVFHRQWELSVSAVTGEEGEEIRSHLGKKKKRRRSHCGGNREVTGSELGSRRIILSIDTEIQGLGWGQLDPCPGKF